MMNKFFRLLSQVRLKAISLLQGHEAYARRIGVKVGRGCRIYDCQFGSEPFLITIGDRVTVTSGVRFLTHDGSLCLVKDDEGRRYRYNEVIVGDDVFIGVNSIIMPGVKVGNQCIVAAGSVVTKSIPDGSVVGGNPARWIMTFDDFFRKNSADCVSDSSWSKTGVYKDDVRSVLDKSFKKELDAKNR